MGGREERVGKGGRDEGQSVGERGREGGRERECVRREASYKSVERTRSEHRYIHVFIVETSTHYTEGSMNRCNSAIITLAAVHHPLTMNYRKLSDYSSSEQMM